MAAAQGRTRIRWLGFIRGFDSKCLIAIRVYSVTRSYAAAGRSQKKKHPARHGHNFLDSHRQTDPSQRNWTTDAIANDY